jgi:hypothetical protein
MRLQSEDVSAHTDAFERLIGEHPLVRYTIETGDGSARKISDFLSLAEFHESAIYRELYSRLGVERQMSITLPGVPDAGCAGDVGRWHPCGRLDDPLREL